MIIDNYYLLLLPQGKESPEKSIKTKKILQRQLSEVKIQQPTTDSNLSVSMSLRNWNKQISKPQIKPKWKKKTLNKYMYCWNWNTIWTGNSICTLSIVQTYLCTFTWGRLLPVLFIYLLPQMPSVNMLDSAASSLSSSSAAQQAKKILEIAKRQQSRKFIIGNVQKSLHKIPIIECMAPIRLFRFIQMD